MKNEKFNIHESFGYFFNMIFINTKRLMEAQLKNYNLTHLQFSILINIYKNNVSTQKELLQYSYGDEAGITRLIDRLELKGYLKRVLCTEDKRKKRLELTNTGTELTEKILSCAIAVNQELTKDLKENESKELLRLLQKVYMNSENTELSTANDKSL